jgi:20S proteasome alpha/beta subunit
MTLAEARKIALTTLKQLMEEKISAKNVEVVMITPQTDDDGKQVWGFKLKIRESAELLELFLNINNRYRI